MYDSYKIMSHLEKEVDKKADTGLRSTTDLDTVVKLSEAMKNFAKTEYYCTVAEAMEQDGSSHEGGYSERRRRDSRGRYSREGGGMSYEGGNSYRRGYSRDGGYSGDGGTSLHECMEKFREELQEMSETAPTREERDRIKGMLQKIGSI